MLVHLSWKKHTNWLVLCQLQKAPCLFARLSLKREIDHNGKPTLRPIAADRNLTHWVDIQSAQTPAQYQLRDARVRRVAASFQDVALAKAATNAGLPSVKA
jgi:hypothetical protein